MIDWGALTLFLYIAMRMSGFILFNPILGRSTFPGLFRIGFIMTLSVAVYSAYGGAAEAPPAMLEYVVRLLLELGIGFAVGMMMRFFLYIPEQAGEIIDTQMGMSMAKNYDPSAHSSLTTTATILNLLMVLLFFAANGHLTLLRLMLTSGEIVPFGTAAFGADMAEHMAELFLECTLLSVKLSLPILAAELMGQVGMGILMKAIPQINVFAINIELKVLIGLLLLLFLLAPISDFLMEVELDMLAEVRRLLALSGGG